MSKYCNFPIKTIDAVMNILRFPFSKNTMRNPCFHSISRSNVQIVTMVQKTFTMMPRCQPADYPAKQPTNWPGSQTNQPTTPTPTPNPPSPQPRPCRSPRLPWPPEQPRTPGHPPTPNLLIGRRPVVWIYVCICGMCLCMCVCMCVGVLVIPSPHHPGSFVCH